jgi:hypothetical protein
VKYLSLRHQAESLDCQGDKADIHGPHGACEMPCDSEVTRKAATSRSRHSVT